MKRKILLFATCLFSTVAALKAQYVTGTAPAQDGNVTATEYYNTNSSSSWLMCWDENYLYLALTGGQPGEPGIVYFDFNANNAANGGPAVGTNGSTTGKSDYGVTPTLPFVSGVRLFFASNLNGNAGRYAELTYNTGSGWSAPTVISASLGTSSGINRELRISWAELRNGIASRPSAFNWCGAASSAGGFIYNAIPYANFTGNSTTTPTNFFYQTVTNTTAANTDNAIATSNISFSNYNENNFFYQSFMPDTLRNIAIGQPSGGSGRLFIRKDLSVSGDIVVNKGAVQVNTNNAQNLNMIGTNQLIKIATSTGGAINGTDVGIGNDLTLNVNSGTTTIDGDATTNFDNEKKFFNISVASGARLALSRGVLVRYGAFNISGALQINANGYVQSSISDSKPVSYGSNGTLIYNNGGNYNVTNAEWPIVNPPANVSTIAAGNDIVLNGARTIQQTLTLAEGTLSTGLFTLTIAPGGIVSRTNGWVNGTMERGFNTGSNVSLPFDIGNATQWLPVNVTLGNVTNGGSIRFSTITGQHPNYATSRLSQTRFLNRYWTGQFLNATFTGGQIQFGYASADLQNGAQAGNLRVLRFNPNAWQFAASTPGVNNVSLRNLSVTGSLLNQGFAAGECVNDIALPAVANNGPICARTNLVLTGSAATAGGVGTFTYLWTGPNNFRSSNLLTGVNAASTAASGTYTLTATDRIGCSATQSTTAVVNTSISATISRTICSNQLPLTWNGFTFNQAGTRIITLTSSRGCDSILTMNLAVTNVTVSAPVRRNVSCFGFTDGSIRVMASNGTAPYRYSNGPTGTLQDSGIFNNLRTGLYRIYVTDSNGCTGLSDTVVISQPTQIRSTFAVTPVSCFGGNNGSFTVNATGGIPSYMYRNNTAGSVYQSSPTFSGLIASPYRVSIKDSAGCEAFTDRIVIAQPAALGASVNVNNATCPTASNGFFIAAGTGGVPPYRYRLGTSGSYVSSGNFASLRPSTYRLFVQDSNLCVFTTTVTVGSIGSNCTPLRMVVVKDDASLAVYPNPSNNRFTLTGVSKAAQVRVIDMNGKVLLSTVTAGHQNFAFGEALKAGFYIVEITTNDGVQRLKCVKQ